MKNVFIVGEDPVTRAILSRVIKDFAPHLRVIGSLPARGSQLKSKVGEFNKLSETNPVILLSDQDTEDCAPQAKKKLLTGISQNDDFVVNIAADEAESWLLADKKGFANYLKIDENAMPDSTEQKFGGPRARKEISVPLKSSYYLTHELIRNSHNKNLREQISAVESCKGPEYNDAICPFIDEKWDIQAAQSNSYSLQGMIKRVEELDEKYK